MSDEVPMEECFFCGDEFDEEHVDLVGGDTYCLGCIDEHGYSCARCGFQEVQSNPMTVCDDYTCSDCYEMYAVQCECCRDTVWEDDTVPLEYEVWCDGCWEYYGGTCELCDRRVHHDTMTSIDMLDESVQESIFDDYPNLYLESLLCTDCERDVAGSERIRRRSSGRERAEAAIRNYSHRPALQVRRGLEILNMDSFRSRALSRHERYYGLELEVELPDRDNFDQLADTAEWINAEFGGFFYNKWDGSLEHGFEVVSHPARLDWWHKEGTEWLEKLTARLRADNYESHRPGTCGLHIHTNKPSVGFIQCKRMVEFVYQPENSAFLRKISRRTQRELDGYASLHSATIGAYEGRKAEITKSALTLAKNAKTGGGRGALNCGGRDTIELRLFRGTLAADRILAALEFYDALLATHDPKEVRGFEPVPVPTLIENIKRKPKQYANLINYMEDLSIVHDSPSTSG